MIARFAFAAMGLSVLTALPVHAENPVVKCDCDRVGDPNRACQGTGLSVRAENTVGRRYLASFQHLGTYSAT
ncbi:hypothetical protein Q4578_10910 [Shimia thalassica]|uniref:hypothetical protein n=1 Tax=Shimia thalassica TaxID=1715693 RepID=UPI0026E3498D|nr:hypothetical protein [Shimia thalassica]MDO6522101.1 hypothetical protein [Shimia thalassica]